MAGITTVPVAPHPGTEQVTFFRPLSVQVAGVIVSPSFQRCASALAVSADVPAYARLWIALYTPVAFINVTMTLCPKLSPKSSIVSSLLVVPPSVLIPVLPFPLLTVTVVSPVSPLIVTLLPFPPIATRPGSFTAVTLPPEIVIELPSPPMPRLSPFPVAVTSPPLMLISLFLPPMPTPAVPVASTFPPSIVIVQSSDEPGVPIPASFPVALTSVPSPAMLIVT